MQCKLQRMELKDLKKIKSGSLKRKKNNVFEKMKTRKIKGKNV